MNILEITDNKTIEWLLSEINPSVRYFTLTELLGKDDQNTEVIETRNNIMKVGIVPEILAHQKESSYWVSPTRFYHTKYTGTVWQLIILAEHGADSSDIRIKNACNYILKNSQDIESYGFAVNNSKKSGGGRHTEVIPCLTGNMLWSLIKLGFIDDERVSKGIEWIIKYQRTDDGSTFPPNEWPYDKFEICWGKHSCHMGVVKSLKALSAIPETIRTKPINDKIDALIEYLMIHHIYKKSHDLISIAKPGWLKPGFPLMYQTDILEILDILTDLKVKDARMNDAISILKSKQNKEKRWNLENSYNGKMLVDIEEKGNPSRWITYKALKILKHSIKR